MTEPVTITIPGTELYDQKNRKFITTKTTTLSFMHSLLSISKWESKWHKSWMSKEPKTEDEMRDYIRCMCTNSNVDKNVFYALTQDNLKKIVEHIEDPHTATVIKKKKNRPIRQKQFVPAELIYCWMSELNIPYEPCNKWHLNNLMTLIDVISSEREKQMPKKGKRNKADQINRMAAENARRRALYNTSG